MTTYISHRLIFALQQAEHDRIAFEEQVKREELHAKLLLLQQELNEYEDNMSSYGMSEDLRGENRADSPRSKRQWRCQAR